jgi:hypothetical protein
MKKSGVAGVQELQNETALSGLRMVINQPPCDDDFDSASSRFDEVFIS